MKRHFPSLIALVILIYCLFHARELLVAWRGAPLEKNSWVIFLVWLSPLSLLIGHDKRESPFFLFAALLTTLLGSLTDMNALHYFGLAFALTAFAPWVWGMVPWLCASVSWMPVAGWAISHLCVEPVFIWRLSIAIVGSLCMIMAYKRSEIK